MRFKIEYSNIINRTQYEDIGLQFNNYSEVNAKYILQVEPYDQNNLLIEALPPIKTKVQCVTDFQNSPICLSGDREMSPEYRLNAITRLDYYLIPHPTIIDVELTLALALRRGYRARSIYDRNLMERITSEDKIDDITCANIKFHRNNKKSVGFSMIGVSGGGKTTIIEHVLSYYPQLIRHIGENYFFTQITYIKVECSYNGGIKGFCLTFFQEVDNILGTNYHHRYLRINIDTMIIEMSKLIVQYSIGVLVVDEIQHIRLANEDLLNVFVRLNNLTNVPIVYIGTYKAYKTLFEGDYRLARRAESSKMIEVTRYNKDEAWDCLISDLWSFQWTKEVVPLSQEIKDAFYAETAGIIDRLIKLFQAVQIEAIVYGKDKITMKLVKDVSKKYFSATQRIVNSILKGDIQALIEYEDVYSKVDIRTILNHSLDDMKRKEAFNYILDAERNKTKMDNNTLRDKVIASLLKLECYSFDEINNAFYYVTKIGGIRLNNISEGDLTKNIMAALISNCTNSTIKETLPSNDKLKKVKKAEQRKKIDFSNDIVQTGEI